VEGPALVTVGPQRHPSRDRRTTHEHEYELPGIGGVNLIPGGYYEKGELEGAAEYHRSEGDTSASVLQPAQGRLFDPEKHEAANRQKLGRERFLPIDRDAEQIRNKALQSSTIPTSHLQDRPGRMFTDVQTHDVGAASGAAGWYRGPATSEKPDVIAVDPSTSHGTDTTFIHEAGHRRHLGEMPYKDDLVAHPRGAYPDPLKEGVADAYVDRYGGQGNPQVRSMQEGIDNGEGKFASYQFTGYSSDRDAAKRFGWNDSDRALYAATRGHASETGEQALYVPRGRDVREQPGISDYGGGDPTVDATLHHLLSTSPHAAQALRQTGLKDVGAQAFRRHRDRELLTQGQAVQGSLFNEVKGVESGKVHGYVPNPDAEAYFTDRSDTYERMEEQHGEMMWPQHMSHNQFGEKPRTLADVSHSLGVNRRHAEKQGFTSF
jgi:hypothetical protein